ncbi:hypothetical protein XB02_19425 [Pantoea ananatis]|nr:hypothetical protein XB02_19425 [Pantoea ananatis]
MNSTGQRNFNVPDNFRSSPGRLLARILSENNMSVRQLCRYSKLKAFEVHLIVRERLIITPDLAEKLGKVFYSPRFWLTSQALWELDKLKSASQADSESPGSNSN